MNKILLYTHINHPRLAYIIRFIQQFIPDFQLVCTNSFEEYKSFEGISINYSLCRIYDREVFIRFSGWLLSDRISHKELRVRNMEEDFQIFPDEYDDEFDVFAALFYVLSRMEEYLPFESDKHGRFTSHQSILFKNKVLALPIVDIWVNQFIRKIELKFSVELKIKKCNPSWSVGIDVDQFFKYKHKSLIKKTGGLLKSFFKLEIKECIHRIKILYFNQNDPYNSFEKIEQLKIDNEQLFFFILSGGHSRYDKNHSLQFPVIQAILKSLNRISKIGLHPSYSSVDNSGDLIREKKNLEECLETSIELSRQHYLKIRFPASYQKLLEVGIKQDYSLGYADYPGFRAGTCRPFYWYDLECEKETNLLLIPFIAMDRTYLDYLKSNPAASENSIKKLFETCMKVGGHFHLIWHNSSYDFDGEWKSWNGVLESLIEYFKNRL